MKKEEALNLKKIYDLVDQLSEDARSHLATNLFQTSEVLEDDLEKFQEIHNEYMAHIGQDVKVEKPSDIPNLPWKGNHFNDQPYFELITDYILNEEDRKKQKEAYYLMGKHGMGIDQAVSDEELDEFIRDGRRAKNRPV